MVLEQSDMVLENLSPNGSMEEPPAIVVTSVKGPETAAVGKVTDDTNTLTTAKGSTQESVQEFTTLETEDSFEASSNVVTKPRSLSAESPTSGAYRPNSPMKKQGSTGSKRRTSMMPTMLGGKSKVAADDVTTLATLGSTRRQSNGVAVKAVHQPGKRGSDAGEVKKVHRRKGSNFFNDGGPILVEEKLTRLQRFVIALNLYLRRFNYFIERTLENQGSVFRWMFAILVIQIAVFGAVVAAISGSFGYEAFFWGAWDSWTFMADPGTHAGTVENSGVGLKLVSVFITFMGIFYFAVILALIVDWVRDRMDSIKKGKGFIVEEDHFLILGWSDKALTLINEFTSHDICTSIVVLSEMDKEEQETTLHEYLEEMGTTRKKKIRIIFRFGNPASITSLQKVSAGTAAAVIILSEDSDNSDISDAITLRIVLSLKGLKQGLKGHIVAEMRDVDNEELVTFSGGDDIKMVNSHDLSGRLMLLSSRQPGLSQVYDELVGFDNNEFYFVPVPMGMVGETFKNACLRFDGAVVIGVFTRDDEIQLNPGMLYTLNAGDDLIMIAESPETVKVLDEPYYLSAYKKMTKETVDGNSELMLSEKKREIILICGWRRDLRDVIIMLNMLVTEKSVLHILCEVPVHTRDVLLTDDGLDLTAIDMLDIVHFQGNSAVRRHLEQLPIEDYTSIMIVADVDRENNAMASDSHTLASLLLIRNIQKKRLGEHPEQSQCTVMCEFLDNRASFMKNSSNDDNTGGAASSGKKGGNVDATAGFVQSHEIISRVMAMVAGRPQLKIVLDELLGYHGASLFVKETARYVRKREMVSFWTVAQRAWDYGEILIGRFNVETGEIDMNTHDKEAAGSWNGFHIICIAGHNKTKGDHMDMSRFASSGNRMKSMCSNQQRPSYAATESVVEQMGVDSPQVHEPLLSQVIGSPNFDARSGTFKV
jgi:Trk K+ transport system NAD-binding subunit